MFKETANKIIKSHPETVLGSESCFVIMHTPSMTKEQMTATKKLKVKTDIFLYLEAERDTTYAAYVIPDKSA